MMSPLVKMFGAPVFLQCLVFLKPNQDKRLCCRGSWQPFDTRISYPYLAELERTIFRAKKCIWAPRNTSEFLRIPLKFLNITEEEVEHLVVILLFSRIATRSSGILTSLFLRCFSMCPTDRSQVVSVCAEIRKLGANLFYNPLMNKTARSEKTRRFSCWPLQISEDR